MVYRAIMAPFLRLGCAAPAARERFAANARVLKLRGLAVTPCRICAAPSQVGAARSQAHNGG